MKPSQVTYQMVRDYWPRDRWCPHCKAWVNKWHQHWTKKRPTP